MLLCVGVKMFDLIYHGVYLAGSCNNNDWICEWNNDSGFLFDANVAI